MKTYMANPDKIERKWYVVDAEGQTLGRMASEIAKVLRGKNKPEFTPHVDTGDYVVVINAEKVVWTGKKDAKVLHHHSGYPGGLRSTTYKELRTADPDRIIRSAVWGMLPKNKLSRAQIKRLRVFAGKTHPFASQKPTVFEVKQISQQAQ